MHKDSVRIVDEQLLSDDYFPLKKIAYEQRRRDGAVQRETREV